MLRHHLLVYGAYLDLLRSGNLEIVVISEEEWEEILRKQAQRKIDEEALTAGLLQWTVPATPSEPALRYRADQYWTLQAKPPSSGKTDPHWISSEIRRRQAAYAKRLSNRSRPKKNEPALLRQPKTERTSLGGVLSLLLSLDEMTILWDNVL